MRGDKSYRRILNNISRYLPFQDVECNLSFFVPLEYRLDLVTLIQRIEHRKGKKVTTVEKPGKYYLNQIIRVPPDKM